LFGGDICYLDSMGGISKGKKKHTERDYFLNPFLAHIFHRFTYCPSRTWRGSTMRRLRSFIDKPGRLFIVFSPSWTFVSLLPLQAPQVLYQRVQCMKVKNKDF
jgi:hypothetical protein